MLGIGMTGNKGAQAPSHTCGHDEIGSVFKRGMGAGYAGVANPLFFLENTRMLFGNARDTISELVSNLREK